MAFDIVHFYQEIILNKIVTAMIIFFLGFMLGKIASNLTKRLLEEVNLNKRSLNTFLGRTNLENVLSVFVAFIIYFGTVLMALNTLGITKYILWILLAFFALTLLSTLILDIRDLLPNLYAWIKIKTKKYFSKGDRIKTSLAEGVVKRITPFTTRVITAHGDELYIKNYAVLENLTVEKKYNS